MTPESKLPLLPGRFEDSLDHLGLRTAADAPADESPAAWERTLVALAVASPIAGLIGALARPLAVVPLLLTLLALAWALANLLHGARRPRRRRSRATRWTPLAVGGAVVFAEALVAEPLADWLAGNRSGFAVDAVLAAEYALGGLSAVLLLDYAVRRVSRPLPWPSAFGR